MQGTGIVRVLAVATTAGVLLFSSSALSIDVCDEAAKAALAEAYKHVGIPGVEPGMVAPHHPDPIAKAQSGKRLTHHGRQSRERDTRLRLHPDNRGEPGGR